VLLPLACFAIEVAEGVHTKKGCFRGTDSKLHLLVRSLAWIDRDRGLTSGSEGRGTSDGGRRQSSKETNRTWLVGINKSTTILKPDALVGVTTHAGTPIFVSKTKTTTSTIISTSLPCRSSTLDLAGTEWTSRLCWNQSRL
jgi:hypothetical protein